MVRSRRLILLLGAVLFQFLIVFVSLSPRRLCFISHLYLFCSLFKDLSVPLSTSTSLLSNPTLSVSLTSLTSGDSYRPCKDPLWSSNELTHGYGSQSVLLCGKKLTHTCIIRNVACVVYRCHCRFIMGPIEAKLCTRVQPEHYWIHWCRS